LQLQFAEKVFAHPLPAVAKLPVIALLPEISRFELMEI